MILPHGEKSGFTLLELLVVLGTVSVLAALSVSAVTTGITRARQAECASNLRQIGTGLLLYATDNGGVLPDTSHTGQLGRSWIYTVAPYLGDVDEIRISPADPNADRRRAESGTSYTLNSIVFNPAYDAVGQVVTRFNRLPLISKPSQTLLATTVSDRKVRRRCRPHSLRRMAQLARRPCRHHAGPTRWQRSGSTPGKFELPLRRRTRRNDDGQGFQGTPRLRNQPGHPAGVTVYSGACRCTSRTASSRRRVPANTSPSAVR